jgi:hypothetical protein
MEKLERYLDRVCRSIGGPKALRQHVRQELREHLLDAMAQHKAAGTPEPEALERALEEFGRPEDVRSELEATHGHRMMAVVIDKAMQWKEMTMKAKWLWTAWAYLAVVVLIALELFFIWFNVLYLIPKFQKLRRDGIIDPVIDEENGVIAWSTRFLMNLNHVVEHYATFLLIGAAAAWGLLEWRVKSENKSFIRLSILGTAAVLLMVVIIMTTGGQIIQFYLGVPAMGKMVRPWAVEQVETIDASTSGIEQALAKKDWDGMREQAEQTSGALTRLTAGPATTSLARGNQPPTREDLRADLNQAREDFAAVQQAIREKNAANLESALQKFRKSFGPVQEAAKKQPRQ